MKKGVIALLLIISMMGTGMAMSNASNSIDAWNGTLIYWISFGSNDSSVVRCLIEGIDGSMMVSPWMHSSPGHKYRLAIIEVEEDAYP
jgi:hypothetical protein